MNSRRRRPARATRRLPIAAVSAALTLAATAATLAAPAGRLATAAAQSADVDTSTALGFTTRPRPTAPPPADRTRPQVLAVYPQDGRTVLADVWSPAMQKAVPTFVLLPADGRPRC